MAESYHTHSHKSTRGFVYILKSDSGHYKIGKARRPDERVGHFTLQLPFKVEIVHTIECEDYSAAEKFMHRFCSHYHVNGEWFNLTEKIVAFFVEYFDQINSQTIRDFHHELVVWDTVPFEMGATTLLLLVDGRDEEADVYYEERIKPLIPEGAAE